MASKLPQLLTEEQHGADRNFVANNKAYYYGFKKKTKKHRLFPQCSTLFHQ